MPWYPGFTGVIGVSCGRSEGLHQCGIAARKKKWAYVVSEKMLQSETSVERKAVVRNQCGKLGRILVHFARWALLGFFE